MIAFAKNSDIQKWFEAKNMSRSNSTQNKRGGYPYEDADFYPKYQEVCQICGISSFAHRHKAGSLPKDFERLPEASKTKERASGEEKHIKLAKYLKGTAKALSRLGDEIIARDNFDKEDEELLSKIGSNLLFEAKAYTFRSN